MRGFAALANPDEFTVTTTGNIDDLNFSNATLIRMNNATISTIRGLKAGLPGQIVHIVSVGAGQVDFAHQNAGSTAENRLINFVTSGTTSLAAGVGAATYQYDGTTTRWRLIVHEQGASIDVPYNAGDFTTDVGTWTVDSGDVLAFRYYLKGRRLSVDLSIAGADIAGSPSNLNTTVPNGFTVANTKNGFMIYDDPGAASRQLGNMFVIAAGTQIKTSQLNGTAFANTSSDDANIPLGTIDFDIN